MAEMGSTKQISDFIVETNGHCFLCLRKIDLVKLEPGLVKGSSPPVYPFQCVSRYLRLEMRNLFSGELPIPPHLLAKVQRSTLKVELCDECAVLNERFSEVFRQLERLEMEVTSWLKEILVRLKVGEDTQRTEQFGGSAQLEALGMERLNILAALRKETMQNCRNKFRKWVPRVCLQKLKNRRDSISRLEDKNHSVPISPSPGPDDWDANDIDDRGGDDDNLGKPVPRVRPQRLVKSNAKPMYEVHSSPSPEPKEDDASTDPDYDDGSYAEENSAESSQEDGTPDWPDQDPADSHEVDGVVQADKINEEATSITNRRPTRPGKSSFNKKVTMRNRCIKTPKGLFKCKDCSKMFKFYTGFYNHYRAEHLNLRYTCPMCCKQYTQLQNYQYHQKHAHKDKDKKDPVTKHLIVVKPPATDKTKDMKPHFTINPESGYHRCNNCSKEFKTLDLFKAHYKNVHSKVKHMCGVCSKVFTMKKCLKLHLRVFHFGQRYKCGSCPKTFTRSALRNDHMRTDCPGKIGQGGNHSIGGPSLSSSNIKVDTHSGKGVGKALSIFDPETGMHKCDICQMGFLTERKFQTHFRATHSKRSPNTRKKISGNAKKGESVDDRKLFRKDAYSQPESVSSSSKCPSPEPMDHDVNADPDYDTDSPAESSQLLAGTPDQNPSDRQEVCAKSEATAKVLDGEIGNGVNTIPNPTGPTKIKREPMKNSYIKTTKGLFKCKDCSKSFKFYSSFCEHYRTEHLKLRYSCPTCGKHYTQMNNYRYHHEHAHKDMDKKDPVIKHLIVVRPSEQNLDVKPQNTRNKTSVNVEVRESADDGKMSDVDREVSGDDANSQPESGKSNESSGIIKKKKVIKKSDKGSLVKKSRPKKLHQTPLLLKKRRRRAKIDPSDEHLIVIEPQPINAKTEEGTTHSSFNSESGKHCCNLCAKEFVSNDDLQKHYDNIHTKVGYKCSLCGKVYAYKLSFRLHYRSSHCGTRYKCEYCQRSFSRPNAKNKHTLGCSLKCGGSDGIPNSDLTISSSNMDTGGENHKCMICSKGFPSKRRLKMHHTKVHRPITSMRLNCKYCEKEFDDPNELQQHVKVTHLVCQHCGKTFNKLDHLTGHVNAVHLRIKQFICHLCGSTFCTRTSLARHTKTVHVRLKDQVCDQCGKGFYTKDTLNKHVRMVHLRERKQECDLCGRRFELRMTLNRHIRALHPGAPLK